MKNLSEQEMEDKHVWCQVMKQERHDVEPKQHKLKQNEIQLDDLDQQDGHQ